MLTPGIHLGGGKDLSASPLNASPFVSPMVASPGRATPGYEGGASPFVGAASPYVSASPAYASGYGSVSSPAVGLGSASPAVGGYSPSSPVSCMRQWKKEDGGWREGTLHICINGLRPREKDLRKLIFFISPINSWSNFRRIPLAHRYVQRGLWL